MGGPFKPGFGLSGRVALHRVRNRYKLPTNEALIAAAVKHEWIPLAIDTTDDPKRRRDQAAGGFECFRLP